MKKLTLLLACLVLAGAQLLFAQSVTITGTVTGKDDGAPIPGVSVVVKGTTIGTITNYEGKYSLSVPQNSAALLFSFVGMKTLDVPIEGRTTIDAVMESEVVNMNEVVVTAMGINRQSREVGYSVSKVDNDLLNESKTVNVSNALSGKVAGLQVNTVNSGVTADTRIVLRGNRSFLGNNQALIVLDGVPVSSTYLSTINPGDIDNVTILKGANAAALYGSEAANGAIMIVTKKGSKGGAKIEYSNSTTFESVSFMPKFQTRFGSGSGTDVNGYPVFTPYENQCYGPAFDGSLVQIGRPIYDGRTQQVTYVDRSGDKKKFFTTGLTEQNSITYSAGDDKGQFFLSAQDADVKGIIPGDKLRRDVIRVNGSRVSGKLKADYSFQYTHQNVDIAGGSSFQDRQAYWLVINTPNEIPLTNYKNWRTDPFASPDGYFNDYYDNPYTVIDKSRKANQSDYMLGSAELEYKAAPWFTALLRTSINYNANVYRNTKEATRFSAFASHSGRSISAGPDANTSGFWPGQDVEGSSMGNRWTNDLILTFNKDFGKFSTTFITGATDREIYSKQYNIGSTAMAIDDFYNISNRIGDPTTLDHSFTQSRFVGAYGDLTLGWNKVIFLHASGRNDWTSVLKKGNNSFFYPGVDLSFVFSDAIPALKSILNYGKLRAGITQVGTLNVNPYQLQNVFATYGSFPYGSLAGFTISNTLNNPNLKPEMTVAKEIGLETGFLDNRVNLTLNVYNQNVKNQTVPVNISAASGYTSTLINTGEMVSKGLELETRLIPVMLANGLTWEIDFMYTHQNSEVKQVTSDLNEIFVGGYTNGEGTYATVGMAYPQLKVVDFKRDPQGRVVIDKATGYPLIDNTLKYLGTTNPTDMFDINTRISFKGFTLSAVLEYRHGAVIWNNIGDALTFTGVGYLSGTNGRQRFVFPNSVYANYDANGNVTGYTPNTNIVTSKGGVEFWTNVFNQASSPFVTSGDFWKLRELALNYNLPKSILPSAIKNVNIGFVGRNLITLLPKSNYYTDPEFSFTTGNSTGINNENNTPPTRTYGFTVSVQF